MLLWCVSLQHNLVKSTRSSTFWLRSLSSLSSILRIHAHLSHFHLSDRSYLIWQSLKYIVLFSWLRSCLMTTPARAEGEDIPPVGDGAAIHLHSESILPVQSEASIMVTWLELTNQGSVFRSRDCYWPMTGLLPDHRPPGVVSHQSGRQVQAAAGRMTGEVTSNCK